MNGDPLNRATIRLGKNHVLRNINQLTSHVSGVSSLQRGISKSLTSTVSRDEVFQHRKTFTEVRGNRTFNNLTGRLSHQTTHTRELLNLVLVTTSTGVDHHEEWVRLLFAFVILKLTIKCIRDIVTSTGPNIDHLLVALAIGDHTIAILLIDGFDFAVSFFKLSWLFLRNHHVDNTNGATRTTRFFKAKLLELIHSLDSRFATSLLITAPDDVSDLTFTDVVVEETNIFWPNFVEADTTWSGLNHLRLFITKDRVSAEIRVSQANALVVVHLAVCDREFHLSCVFKEWQVTLILFVFRSADLSPSKVVSSENDILRRSNHRTT